MDGMLERNGKRTIEAEGLGRGDRSRVEREGRQGLGGALRLGCKGNREEMMRGVCRKTNLRIPPMELEEVKMLLLCLWEAKHAGI